MADQLTMDLLTTTLLSASIATAPAWSLQWSPRFDAARDVLGQTYQTKRQTTELTWQFAADQQAQLAHEFRDLDLPEVDGVPAATNSYVHRLTFAWEHRTDTLRMRLGITVAASSNALKSPGDLDAKDLRPDVRVGARAGPVWLMLNADDRLGRTLVYPGFEWLLRPATSHEIRLGFPETSWLWQIAPQWTSATAIEPDGACWQVRDKEFERSSDVCSRSWQAAWTLRWQAARFLGVEAAIGYSFASSLDYQLLDGRDVSVDVPSGAFYLLRLGARF